MALLLTSVAALAAADDDVVWLETEQFANYGGWANDPQFIDQMGSPYLLANGIGRPVDDAIGHAAVAAAGRYRLWARTRDWYPSHHPGTFQILLNGQAATHVFGRAGKAGWQWEDGGVHDLPAGQLTVALHDLTGYYGRCDVLVLCRELQWQPPTEPQAVAALRERWGGVSPEFHDMPEADVVVVGGGLAGCTAAVAAARNGARVVLIQNRPVLGGNASTEILVPPVGAWSSFLRDYPLDPRETGFVEEYRTRGLQRVSEGKLYSSRLLRWVRLEPKLQFYLDTHATGVELAADGSGRIAAVRTLDTHSGQRLRFPGHEFIDCTGDGTVGVAAGAEYRHGKEPSSMYDEPYAPPEPTRNTMGNGLKYFAREGESPQPFKAPAWAYRFPDCDGFPRGRHPRLTTTSEIGQQWQIELGGLRDTYADAEEIRDDLLRLIFGLWDHTKNHCPHDRERAAKYRLVWVGHIAGKRENRRLIGDYVLTQNDIANQTLFPDRVAFGAWSVDDHHSAGFFHRGSFGTHIDRPADACKGLPFHIPFRSLYSKNVPNLLMAGRDISASHLGLADVRVMLTCAIMGHAVGTGAALCVSQGITPRQLGQEHLAEFQQQLLKEGAAVLELEANDPRDLAPKAHVTASSWRRHVSGDAMKPENVINGFARAEGRKGRELTNAWGPDTKAAGPHWLELEWPEPVTFNVVHVTFQTAELAPRWFAVDTWRDGAWQRLVEVGRNRHRRHVLGLDTLSSRRVRIVENEARAICEVRVYQESDDVVASARRAHRNMRLPDTGPFLPWGDEEAVPPAAARLGGTVLDAEDAELTGDWVSSTWAEPYVGDGYLHDGNEGKGAKSIRFELRPPLPGNYQVRLAYVAFSNRASNTPVTINSAVGPRTVHVNQRQKGTVDGWLQPLGQFRLDGTSSLVVENVGTDGYVVVDAVQLLPVPDGNAAE